MKKSNVLRCVHRHTIGEHPQCFAKGLVKQTTKVINKEKIEIPWYQEPGVKIGYFDIETDNLNADFGTLLSWAIKEKNGPCLVDYITRDDLFNGVYMLGGLTSLIGGVDYRIVKSFVDAAKKFDILVGYYSTGFDFPFMRAKALRYNLDFPGYGELYHWDIYYTVKSKLKISSKSLANACDYLGIVGKTPLDKNVWRAAKYADPEAIKKVVEHNIGDVEITEKLHDRISFARKWIKKSV